MNAFLRRVLVCCGLLFMSLMTGAGVANAAPCNSTLFAPARQCSLDQQQWVNAGGDGLGGAIVLAQTFTPNLHTRVCAVRVKIYKNNPVASDLTLHVLDNNFAVLRSATLPAAVIPMGLSEQTFTFHCSGPLLPAAPFYGLKLESPASAPADYTWINSDANGNLYAGGQGWRSVKGGGVGTFQHAAYDYAFQVYMCN
jgi:hypothetical protein